MDKRLEEKKRVKNSIALAYFDLLRENREDIYISEICSRAGVSRMAYYRNFSSKNQIIEYYLSETIWSDLEELPLSNVKWLSKEFCIHFFNTMKKYSSVILLLNDRGYAGLILDAFNLKNEELAGDMPANSIEKYKLYSSAGAAFNVAVAWMKYGCVETAEELVDSFIDIIRLMAI